MTEFVERKPISGADLAAVDGLMVYGDVFRLVALIAIGAGVFALVISPLLKRGMQGVR